MEIRKKYLSGIVISILSFSVITQAFAAEDEKKLPLLELELGAGVVHQSYYTGTTQTREIFFPIVKPIYRGKFFKSDEKGLRAELFKNGRVQLDVSADLNLAIDSDEIELREGLDDIDNIVQFGPSLEILLNETDDSQLFFNVPVRGVFEIGDDFEASGFTVSPNLYYRKKFETLESQWELGVSVGPQFGTEDFHDIYYGVGEEFATATRNAYDAESGYSGARAQVSLKAKKGDNTVLLFLRYDNIEGAVFDDSPLVETDENLTVGLLYSRNVFKSKALAK